jgi:chitosanase
MKTKIQSILNVWETGRPDGDYGKVTILPDGPGGKKQITYGRSQTTEFGHLKTLLKKYYEERGQYGDAIWTLVKDRMYMKGAVSNSLCDDTDLITLLSKAGSDPVMRQVQDEFFDKFYWLPAARWFNSNGFTLPLSMLVIYDSFIHSGNVLPFLRKRFSARPPAAGGSEMEWITQYVNTRHNWLSNHSSKYLRNSSYRTRDLLRSIEEKNWDLKKPFRANGIIVK